jgi:PAS domain S-box-containing protein
MENNMADNSNQASSQNIFKIALDHLQDGCQIIDSEYRYIYLNPVAIQHSKKTEIELIGQTMMSVYPGIEKTEMFARLRYSLQFQKTDSMENRFEFPDGEEGWFKLSFEPNPRGLLYYPLTLQKKSKLKNQYVRKIDF